MRACTDYAPKTKPRKKRTRAARKDLERTYIYKRMNIQEGYVCVHADIYVDVCMHGRRRCRIVSPVRWRMRVRLMPSYLARGETSAVARRLRACGREFARGTNRLLTRNRTRAWVATMRGKSRKRRCLSLEAFANSAHCAGQGLRVLRFWHSTRWAAACLLARAQRRRRRATAAFAVHWPRAMSANASRPALRRIFRDPLRKLSSEGHTSSGWDAQALQIHRILI